MLHDLCSDIVSRSLQDIVTVYVLFVCCVTLCLIHLFVVYADCVLCCCCV